MSGHGFGGATFQNKTGCELFWGAYNIIIG
jgi:hypothetical protein